NAEMVKRVLQRCPKSKIELVVQQRYTTLPVGPLKKVRGKVALSELRNSSRRLHAKLLAWQSAGNTVLVVGSPNFTTAAFDARNVETCLLVKDAGKLVDALFDRQLDKRPISLADFDPGTDKEPEPVDLETVGLRLTSAVLASDGKLRVAYRHSLPTRPTSLHL